MLIRLVLKQLPNIDAFSDSDPLIDDADFEVGTNVKPICNLSAEKIEGYRKFGDEGTNKEGDKGDEGEEDEWVLPEKQRCAFDNFDDKTDL